ncbi:hypothetical protein [Pseudomonas sp. NPDC089547]|uniref:hypothetical protein n=1 Tax=Pseudomonas sp. NPDC089547 TaxID=3390652 RepID=UPI003CFF3E63
MAALASLRNALALAMLLLAPLASAIELTITAQYRGGGSGRFENTTPPGHMCERWPLSCRGRTTVDLPISFTKKTVKGAPDWRDRGFLQAPAAREIDVYHESGEPRRMRFKWELLSFAAYSPRLDRNPFWSQLGGGCTSGGQSGGWANGRAARAIFLSNPDAPEPCWTDSTYAPEGTVMTVNMTEFAAAFVLDMPPPYRLRSGIYRGTTTYRIGPGGDFDFGNDVTDLSTDTLTLNFELDVQHPFLVEFPPGSERAVLEPKGGWQAWLSGGKAPGRLYRDLPFRLWSTGPFKAYKLCQYDSGAGCAIRNDNNENAAVQVSLSLPPGVQYLGNPVQHLALPTGRHAALHFEASMPTINRPGQLHFEAGRDEVQGMLKNPGQTYTGQVTVIFDAEL